MSSERVPGHEIDAIRRAAEVIAREIGASHSLQLRTDSIQGALAIVYDCAVEASIPMRSLERDARDSLVTTPMRYEINGHPLSEGDYIYRPRAGWLVFDADMMLVQCDGPPDYFHTRDVQQAYLQILADVVVALRRLDFKSDPGNQARDRCTHAVAAFRTSIEMHVDRSRVNAATWRLIRAAGGLMASQSQWMSTSEMQSFGDIVREAQDALEAYKVVDPEGAPCAAQIELDETQEDLRQAGMDADLMQ